MTTFSVKLLHESAVPILIPLHVASSLSTYVYTSRLLILAERNTMTNYLKSELALLNSRVGLELKTFSV